MDLDKLDSNNPIDYLTNLKSPLNKETCVYLDPFDVFNTKYSKSASAANSNLDTASTKLEEESTKSIYSLEHAVKVKTIETQEEIDQNQNMTLSEIISKKKRQSTIKENKKRCVALNMDGRKKKKTDPKQEAKNLLNNDKESKNMKQEFENNSAGSSVPKIVLVNGIPELQVSSANATRGNDNLVVAKLKLTTSNSFKNYNHTDKWTEQETKKFYRALELFGTDFSLVAQLFPNRNRMQIKNKFLKEEKTSPKKIDEIFSTKDKSALKLLAKVSKLNHFKPPQIKMEDPSDNVGGTNSFDALNQKPKSLLIHNPLELDNTSASRKPRSESFASMTSVDMEIVNDLSDLFKNEPTYNLMNKKS